MIIATTVVIIALTKKAFNTCLKDSRTFFILGENKAKRTKIKNQITRAHSLLFRISNLTPLTKNILPSISRWGLYKHVLVVILSLAINQWDAIFDHAYYPLYYHLDSSPF